MSGDKCPEGKCLGGICSWGKCRGGGGLCPDIYIYVYIMIITE